MNFFRKTIVSIFILFTLTVFIVWVNIVKNYEPMAYPSLPSTSNLMESEQHFQDSDNSVVPETNVSTTSDEKQGAINLQQLLDGVDKSLKPFSPSDMSNQNRKKRTLHNKFIELAKIYTPTAYSAVIPIGGPESEWGTYFYLLFSKKVDLGPSVEFDLSFGYINMVPIEYYQGLCDSLFLSTEDYLSGIPFAVYDDTLLLTYGINGDKDKAEMSEHDLTAQKESISFISGVVKQEIIIEGLEYLDSIDYSSLNLQ